MPRTPISVCKLTGETQNLAPADNVLHFKAILECGGYATKAYWQMKLTPVVAISTRTVPLGAAETEEFKPESQVLMVSAGGGVAQVGQVGHVIGVGVVVEVDVSEELEHIEVEGHVTGETGHDWVAGHNGHGLHGDIKFGK